MSAFSDAKIKHLEMIQDVITRMAQNSFSLKGWAVTLVVGVLALSVQTTNHFFFLVAYLPILLFWGLDAYYLQLERKYRVLYREQKCTFETDFGMRPPHSNWKDKTYYIQSVFSITEVPFYILLASVITLVITIVVKGEC